MLSAELPLKLTKPVDLNAGARAFFDAPVVRSQVTPAAREEVERLHVKRNQLCTVQKLSITMAEDAAREFISYSSRLARFERRLEHGGRELGVRFAWKDAFKTKLKVDKPDFEWERACALFNAAACYAFLGATAHARGAVDGGLRAAKLHFEAAAGCISTVHGLVRANIWGLNPKWDPQSLSPDMHVDLLAAFKTLMLAQAQCAFCQKAVAESVRADISSKLAAQAAALFREARYTFEQPTHSQYLCGEGGLFSGADRSWIARVRANEEIFEAMAHELMASEAAAAYNYGAQVARLRLARSHAEAAEREADSLGGREKKAISALRSKLQHSASEAEKDNVNIYQEQVPSSTALPKIELKLLVKPTPPEDDTQGQPDPLRGLLPPALTTALQKHFDDIESKLYALTTRSSEDALRCQEALSSHRMPEALEACETDTKLPERILRAIVEAQEAGSLSDLRSQLDLCGNLEGEALDIVNLAGGLLSAEEDKDAQFLSENPALSLSQLRSSDTMSQCRTELHAARGHLRQAVDVTHKLRERLDKASDEIALIEAPVEQLAQQMPHKDGTPLSNEPCVPALYDLMHRLSQIKVQVEESIARWRRLKAEQQQSAALGEALLAMEATDVQQKLQEELKPYVEAAVEYSALQRQREELLQQVDVQARLFENAQRDASSFDARQRYLRQLSLGAEEASAIAKGLAEGVAFYNKILSQLRRKAEQASQLADERAKERDELVNAEARRKMQEHDEHERLSQQLLQQQQQRERQQQQQQWQPTAYSSASSMQTAIARPIRADPHGHDQHHNHHQQAYPGAHAQSQIAVAQAYPASAGANAQRLPQAVAQSVPAPLRQSAAPPSIIMCYKCRKQFGVPPHTSVIGCPYCSAHNRVPGA